MAANKMAAWMQGTCSYIRFKVDQLKELILFIIANE
jgi:hypothetical protein